MLDAVQLDFAYATRAVLYGMIVALALSLVVAFFHPGTRVVDREEQASGERRPAGEPQPGATPATAG